MKMNFGFGVYEDEIEPVLAAVRCHRPLAEIQALACPCCGARMEVWFSPEGGHFHVGCTGELPHLSQSQKIAQPPDWWQQRIADTGPITFYWQKDSCFADDGRLEMPASGYDADGNHWSGRMVRKPDHADYPLWCWIVGQKGRYKPLISDRDLEAIRKDFQQTD
jgi:hypothetical protein